MGRYIFVDDEQSDRVDYSKLLTDGGLSIFPIRPDPKLSNITEALKLKDLDGVIVDYFLGAGDAHVSYRGGTLAAHIRTERPGVPIAVLSAALKKRPSERASYERIQDMFDLELDKSEVMQDARSAIRSLQSLASGYNSIKSTFKPGRKDSIPQLLRIEPEQQPELIGLLYSESRGDTARLARTIIQLLLRLPGPLLDPARAVVSLGVCPSQTARLAKAMKGALYGGVFANAVDSPRYWAHLLNNIKLPKGTVSAECGVCGGRASTICEKCSDPFDGVHSLGIIRSGAPAMFADGRVCGFCLRGGIPDEFDLGPGAREMVKTVVAEAKASRGGPDGKR